MRKRREGGSKGRDNEKEGRRSGTRAGCWLPQLVSPRSFASTPDYAVRKHLKEGAKRKSKNRK